MSAVATARTLERLEFDRLLARLARHASSPLGREAALALLPSADRELIRRWQAETSEGREILRLDPTADLGGWFDLRSHLQRAERGGTLDGPSLFEIGATLGAVRRVKEFFARRTAAYPRLASRASTLVPAPDLERRIAAAILPGGEVADPASPPLADLRRRLQQARLAVKEYLDRAIRSPSLLKYLQEPIVTMREGRYVLPVKVEYRGQVPGLIHDQSASGATLFIEPMAAVEKNNEIRRLEAAEKREVQRILDDLTRRVTDVVPDLALAMDVLGHLDFVLAKARWAEELDAVAPEIGEGAHLAFRRARHPLIPGRAVPIDGHLGTDFDTLVVTGPNTGGKTVALKTVGVLVLIAQAGLHVPAEECRVGLFDRVFADIGDEQSIENALSTFSSHMANIVHILAEAGSGSLVLIDELGTGTDPVEGAALAQSILESLQSSGARTIATTHLGELKQFAATRERVANASVEFDAVTLEPTYRLIIGRPGRSNAFEIARRLGLPERVVARARDFLTADQQRAEELLADLERQQRETEQARMEAERLREQAATDAARRRQELDELLGKKKAVLERAAVEAREALRAIRLEGEGVIRELRERVKAATAREREMAIQEARERIEALHDLAPPPAPVPDAGEAPAAVTAGDGVYLPRYGQFGQVIGTAREGDEVLVQVGAVKVTVPLTELRASRAPQARRERTAGTGFALQKSRDFKRELDLRGKRVEEALAEIEKYLDDAVLAGVTRVHLIHGKGTGALRAAVQEWLKDEPRVSSFRLGDQDEGGLGVTVVDLGGRL
ncbi:MAG: endonuclease MutS2 [Bacillota bacterium]|nr:endonuclease MutS2 [Bacillota bacterium]